MASPGVAVPGTNRGTVARGISGRAIEGDANGPWRAGAPPQCRGGSVLGHDQVQSAVMVEVAQGGPSLFAKADDTGFARGHRDKTSLAVATEPESATGVGPRPFDARGEEVLGQEKIVACVPVARSSLAILGPRGSGGVSARPGCLACIFASHSTLQR